MKINDILFLPRYLLDFSYRICPTSITCACLALLQASRNATGVSSSLLQRFKILNALENWASQHASSEDRAEAKKRILRCYQINPPPTNLTLANLKLSTLPDCLYSLTHLTSLDLRGNELRNLPESLCKLTELSYLNLGNNQLNELPSSIGDLTHLTFLNVQNNRLTTLPSSIENLSQLKTFDATANDLKYLPYSLMRHLKQKTKMDFSSFTFLNRLQRDGSTLSSPLLLLSPPPPPPSIEPGASKASSISSSSLPSFNPDPQPSKAKSFYPTLPPKDSNFVEPCAETASKLPFSPSPPPSFESEHSASSNKTESFYPRLPPMGSKNVVEPGTATASQLPPSSPPFSFKSERPASSNKTESFYPRLPPKVKVEGDSDVIEEPGASTASNISNLPPPPFNPAWNEENQIEGYTLQ